MPRKRSNVTGLARLLANCPGPVYALDERRRIVYCNAALTDWLGVGPRDLMGQRCDYHSDAPSGGSSPLAAGLCPPPEAFRGVPLTTDVGVPDASGSTVRRRARFVPVGNAAPGGGVIVFVDAEETPRAASVASAEDFDPAALHRCLAQLRTEMGRFYQLSQIVGTSPAMARVREQVKLAAAGHARTLIVGPPGSGREFMARAVYYGGGTERHGPLTPLACNLLDAELLESTLASFVARSTEFDTPRPAALLLLEVDQLPPDAQAVLEATIGSEARLQTVSTARTPLLHLAKEDRFRPSLAFHLSTLVIELSPLAARAEDVPLLAQHFVERYNAQGGKQLAGVARDALDQLQAYPWPGNGDELSDFIRAACERAAGPLVQATDLPERIQLAADAAARPPRAVETIVLDEFLAEIEKELMQRALKQAKGNKTKAARLLGVTRARLLRRLQQLGVEA